MQRDYKVGEGGTLQRCLELILYLLLVMGPTPKRSDLFPHETLKGKKSFFLCKYLSTGDSSWVRDRYMHTSPLSSRIPNWDRAMSTLCALSQSL